MAGILDQQMDTAPAADQPGMTGDPAAAMEAPGDDMGDDMGGDTAESLMTPEGIEAKMALPGKLKQQLDKIVLAGVKMMFSEKTHKLMLDELDKPGPIEQKLAQGIAGLVAMLFQQSQRSIPPQLLIPAGVLLLAHAVQFLKKSGEDVTPEQFGAAMKMVIEIILRQAKVDPEKLRAHIDGGGQPAQQPAGPAPDQAAPAAPPPQGLIGQAGAPQPMEQ